VLDYLIRRIGIGVLTLVVITFLIMALIRNMPGDPVKMIAAGGEEGRVENRANAELMEMMRKSYGLDKPWYVGYWTWMGNVVRGDLGRSYYDQKPVTLRIGERIGATLTLSLISIALIYLVSIPLGIYATARNGRWQEQLLSSFLYMLYSFPALVMALYLILLFSVKLDLLPLRGMRSDVPGWEDMGLFAKALDRFKHLVMPVFCYTYGGVAFYTRFVRSNLLEVVRQDYVRTARAKGLSEPTVLFKHAFRNSLIPLVTLLGLALPGLLGGSVILEQIFSWPGIGRLFLEAILQRDYPVIMGVTFMFAVMVLIGNLLADVLYAFVDPRITYK
jgi:peptide/nickel transport system permease protein